MSHSYSSVEARVFVRHTSGNLIVPEQPEDSIERLSFSIPLTDPENPLPQIAKIQKDEDAGMGFFYIQHNLGPRTGIVANGQRFETPLAHGFLAQSHSPKASETAGHMELSVEQAKDILNHSPAIDMLERQLAFGAFNVIAHGQIHAPLARKEAPVTPPSRDRLARDTMRESAIFSKSLETAFGNQPMSPEDRKKLLQKYGSLVHSARMLLDLLDQDLER